MKGHAYIGTYGGGMYVFDLKTRQLKDFAPDHPMPFLNGHIFCLYTDHDENLWIGTSNGLYRYNDGKIVKHFTDKNSQLPEGNIYAIYIDSTGKGWICGEEGICLWDPATDTIKADVFPEGFPNQEKIFAIYEDSAHELYFLPYKGRILISSLDMNRFHRMDSETPLEGKNVMFMLEDKEKWLWFGTSNGLYRYDKKESFIAYNFADGIPSPIFLACNPATDKEGTLWFGNSKGLLRLSADWKQKADKHKYKTRFSAVYANGQQTSLPITQRKDGSYEISLNLSQKNVTLCFSGFTFTDPAHMLYEYRMEGVDKGWQALSGKSEVTYYDLASGKHIFRVRQMGKPDSEASLYIYRLPPKGYVWAAVSLLALIALSALLVWRKRKNSMAVAHFLQRPEENITAHKGKEAAPDTPAEEKYKTCNITTDECRRLTEQLKQVMRKEKPYTNPELKIADLASLIGIPPYSMSYLFNQYLKRNYYDYINDYRIAEFKSLVNKGEHTKYTLTALMELCGFNSRSTFFRCFKKTAGITPSEYIKSLEKQKDK